MATDIHLAFANPETRAAATAGPGPLDRISVRDHVVEVEIGAFQSERGRTQRVRFNVVVEISPPEGPTEDDVDRILSYDTLTDAIATELAAERLNLLETLAERIAGRVLSEPRAQRVFVRIEKLDRGPGALGVEIVRSRDQGAPVRAAGVAVEPGLRPIVAYLSDAAILWTGLDGWIRETVATGRPLILCVGPAEIAAPRMPAAAAQRRIDLLAIEQNAWVLAGHHPGLVVAATRTELDWAARNGRVSIWAPIKQVLDAVGDPVAAPADGPGLALWFATRIGAGELVMLGARVPAGAPIPARRVSVTT